ncbi:uncharacterized protein YjbJ (UPF0337 family) [Nocardioides aromaticivorans]|uniref:Uncharacterized protein YjbJ (UPF0337 family) n=1 Tax=Nocardioides aromaticivorans TaxID=200618 RepID=A0A7Y9ZIZ5_9ACTN|nr:DUF3618 domain-containing protein [Nocardioides aromaticivorans]NYI46297.1 uncharacterized protein YjbJ (UPF0337 family) [Nocardioides aromaticivorans]
MGQATEERMTAQIDSTRNDLSRDVDALYDRVSPHRIVERRKSALRGRMSSMKESVMGTAHDATGSAQGAAQGAAESVQHTAQAGVQAVGRRAEGSPIGAGLVAFGAGMVIAALIPASPKEAELAGRLTEAAKDSPLMDEAKAAGQEMASNLKESATEAAQEVKASAQESADHLKDEGRSAAEDVRREAPGT